MAYSLHHREAAREDAAVDLVASVVRCALYDPAEVCDQACFVEGEERGRIGRRRESVSAEEQLVHEACACTRLATRCPFLGVKRLTNGKPKHVSLRYGETSHFTL